MPHFSFLRHFGRDLGFFVLGASVIGALVYGLLNWTIGTLVVCVLAGIGWVWLNWEA